MDKQVLTGVKKRDQIQKANKTMFIWVIVAATAVAIFAVLAQFLIRQMIFNQKIIDAKSETNQILVDNKETFESVKTEVNKLISNANLSQLRAAQEDTALQVVIDALPTEDDRSVLGTSLQQVVLARSGVTIESISVTDSSSSVSVNTSTTGSAVSQSSPQEIAFEVKITGNYAQVSQAMVDLESSIRPFSIKELELEGDSNRLQATVSAVTYYQPAKTISVTKEALKP